MSNVRPHATLRLVLSRVWLVEWAGCWLMRSLRMPSPSNCLSARAVPRRTRFAGRCGFSGSHPPSRTTRTVRTRSSLAAPLRALSRYVAMGHARAREAQAGGPVRAVARTFSHAVRAPGEPLAARHDVCHRSRASFQRRSLRSNAPCRHRGGMWSNPSIERTSQRPLRALCAAAHVER